MFEDSAQGTVEYAIVFCAFLGMLVVLGMLWQTGAGGAFVALASEAASHQFNGMGTLDIALF